MKNTYLALLTAALLGFVSVAVADESINGPLVMTDSQLGSLVAGRQAGEALHWVYACHGNGPCGPLNFVGNLHIIPGTNAINSHNDKRAEASATTNITDPNP